MKYAISNKKNMLIKALIYEAKVGFSPTFINISYVKSITFSILESIIYKYFFSTQKVANGSNEAAKIIPNLP